MRLLSIPKGNPFMPLPFLSSKHGFDAIKSVAVYFIAAQFIALAVFLPGTYVEGAGGLAKAITLFESDALAKSCLVLAIILALYFLKPSGKPNLLYAVTGLVFGVIQVVSASFQAYNNMSLITNGVFQVVLSLAAVIGYALLLYYVLLIVSAQLRKRPAKTGKETSPAPSFFSAHLFPLCFVIMLCCWAPYLIFDYPGTLCPDSLMQLQQFSGELALTAHHPVFSTLLMGSLWKLGALLGSASFGCFLYPVLQSAICAATFALCIKKIKQMGFSDTACFLTCLFFGLVPIWGRYMQWVEKDPLFAGLMVLFLVSLLGMLRHVPVTWKDAAVLAVLGFLCAMMRNNGIYSVVPALFLLIFAVPADTRRKVIAVLVSVLAANTLFTAAIFPVAGIQNGSSGEALSILFQQTARYVAQYPNQVTDQEKQAISEVLDYDTLAANYNPLISDPVKSAYHATDTQQLVDYLHTWFSMGLKHPVIYATAFINQCFGYFGLGYVDYESQMAATYPWQASQGMAGPAMLQHLAAYLDQLSHALLRIPLLTLFARPSFYTWIMICCLVLLGERRRFRDMIPFVPFIMVVLVCIASPMAGSMRYELPLVAATPLLLAFTVQSVSSHTLASKKRHGAHAPSDMFLS